MKPVRVLVASIGLGVAVLTAASCSGENTPAAATTNVNAPAVKLPSKMLGLAVNAEDIHSRLEQSSQPFIDSVGLFAFRERADLLDATLEVARFTPQARTSSSDFQGSIVSRIGGINPQQLRVSDQAVYLTAGRNQVVFIWFKSRHFFVLTVRTDYPFPRTLLRRLIALRLGS